MIATIFYGALYYLVLTPVAFARRLWGRDPLEFRGDASRETYWRRRNVTELESSAFRHQSLMK